jgi:hypothetical protein
MDGEAFDQLSVQFHRLREQATRRGALGLLMGGVLVATGGLRGNLAGAKYKHHHHDDYYHHHHNNHNHKHKHNNCHGYGAFCHSDSECCTHNCINNHCYPGHGGGGGGHYCNGIHCPNGWDCQWNGGVSVCVPDNFNNCCGSYCYGGSYGCCDGNYGGGACPPGWDCCGFNQCCGDNQHCCGNGRCCPDGWSCNNNGTCDPYYYDGVSASSAESIPSTPAIAIDESEYYKIPEQ